MARPKDTTLARFYGLPKVHKDGAPLRPIVSLKGTPTYGLAKWLFRRLKFLTAESDTTVSSSAQLLEKLKGDLAIEKIKLLLQSKYDETENRLGHAQVLQLLKLCLRTYFTFDWTIYEQVKGTPMGSPISGFIAEAVLQRLESLVYQHHRPRFWARYVDDTFVVIERDQVLTFQEHLNAVFPDIQFTMEEDENNQLAFLDVLIKIQADNKNSLVDQMDFRFDFFEAADKTVEKDHVEKSDRWSFASQSLISLAWLPALALPHRKCSLPSGKVIEYLDESAIEDLVKTQNSVVTDEAVLAALHEDKDVVAGVIEGGFTVWEGTRHLLNFLDSGDGRDRNSLKGKRVLDLGCGSGLLGIYALHQGADRVVFQDYNELILRAWTIPNVSVACSGDDRTTGLTESVSFYSGDWHDLSGLWRALPDLRFDLILTAETIYRPELYAKLHDVLDVALARHPDSLIIMVNKLNYYGIGGNVYDFEKFVETKGVFSLHKKQLTDSGTTYVCLSMKRILKD
ncbi:Histidine protein methyltransferase 1 [Sparganum proliferum]